MAGTAAFNLPVLTLSAAGVATQWGSAAFSLPVQTLSASGYGGTAATAAFALPALLLAASGITGETGTAAFSLPGLSLLASGSAEQRLALPTLTLVGIGAAGHVGEAAFDLPALTFAGTGFPTNIGTAAFNLPVVTLLGIGAHGSIGAAAFGLPSLRLSAAGATGQLGTGAFSLPVLTLVGSGLQNNIGTAAFNLPCLFLSAEGAAVLAEAYRTWVLNTRKAALTEYDLEFNSYALFNGLVLAASPAGVVSLGTQTQDGTTVIPWRVRFAKSDYGESHLKRVPRLYVGLKASGNIKFRTITSETGERTYRLLDNHVVGFQQRRVPIGQGPKSVFWAYEAENDGEATVSIKNVLAYPVGLRRRIQ